MSDETTTRFLLTVFKHADFKFDWRGVARELDINTANLAQRRFKSIVEKAGFTLKDGKQVTGGPSAFNNATASTNTTSNATPKKAKARNTTESESPAKKRKTTKAVAAKVKEKPEEENVMDEDEGVKVEAEAEDGEDE